MGAAALTGLIDYSYASKAGLLNSLYQEESRSTGSTLLPDKTIELEDYSRKAFDPPEIVEAPVIDEPKKKKQRTNHVPPPPPPAPEPPLPPDVKEADIAPPPPPKEEVPVTGAVPALEVVNEIPATPAVEPVIIEEDKEIKWESFSRAPLKKKKTKAITKRKQ